MSCWVLGNSLRKATTLSRVCFRSRYRSAKGGKIQRGKRQENPHKYSVSTIQMLWQVNSLIVNSLESLCLLRFRLSLWYSPRLLLKPEERDNMKTCEFSRDSGREVPGVRISVRAAPTDGWRWTKIIWMYVFHVLITVSYIYREVCVHTWRDSGWSKVLWGTVMLHHGKHPEVVVCPPSRIYCSTCNTVTS